MDAETAVVAQWLTSGLRVAMARTGWQGLWCTLPEQEQLGGYPIDQVPLAVHVPMNSEETVPDWAFAGVPRLRHVSVESGIRLIAGNSALSNCRPQW